MRKAFETEAELHDRAYMRALTKKAQAEISKSTRKVDMAVKESVSKIKQRPSKESQAKVDAENKRRDAEEARETEREDQKKLLKNKQRMSMNELISKQVIVAGSIKAHADDAKDDLLRGRTFDDLAKDTVEAQQKRHVNKMHIANAALASVQKKTAAVRQAAFASVKNADEIHEQKSEELAESAARSKKKVAEQLKLAAVQAKQEAIRNKLQHEVAFKALAKHVAKQRAEEMKSEIEINKKLDPVRHLTAVSLAREKRREDKKKILSAFLKKKRKDAKRKELAWAKKESRKFDVDYEKVGRLSAEALTVGNVAYRKKQLDKIHQHIADQTVLSKKTQTTVLAYDHALDELIKQKLVDKVRPRFEQALESKKAALQTEKQETADLKKQEVAAEAAASAAATVADKEEAKAHSGENLISSREARNGLSELLGRPSKDADADDFINSLGDPDLV